MSILSKLRSLAKRFQLVRSSCPNSRPRTLAYTLTHPRKSHLLPLVERLVEARERGADRGGGGAYGGKPLAHRLHAPNRRERGVGGAGGTERVGGFERGADEFVEGDALGRTQANVALDLAHRPVAQHRG